MFWLGWIVIYLPVLLIMHWLKVPEHIFTPIAVVGALVFVALDMWHIFTGFGSSNAFFGSGKKAEKILATGKPAEATLLSIDENSKGGVVTINDQPLLNLKLLVEDGQKAAYEVSFDTVVPRSAVPQFQPGAKFKVKIDPNDPQIVVLDAEATAELPRIGGEEWEEGDSKMIKEHGLDGVAKLLSVEATGQVKDFKPEVKMRWQVKCAKWGEYDIDQKTYVTSEIAGQLKGAIGKSFSAKIHPEKKERTSMEIRF